MYKVKTIETNNNTYQFGFKFTKAAKTSYEQQQEEREEFIYMTFQKLVGVVLTLASIIGLAFGLEPSVFTFIIGIALILSKEHEIMI